MTSLYKKNSTSTEQDKYTAFKKAYQKSTIYLPLYYLIVWIVCSILYFNASQPDHLVQVGISIGIVWGLLNTLADFLVWMGIKKGYQLSWSDIYIKSQPWTGLSYYTILISPIIIAISLLVIRQ